MTLGIYSHVSPTLHDEAAAAVATRILQQPSILSVGRSAAGDLRSEPEAHERAAGRGVGQREPLESLEVQSVLEFGDGDFVRVQQKNVLKSVLGTHLACGEHRGCTLSLVYAIEDRAVVNEESRTR